MAGKSGAKAVCQQADALPASEPVEREAVKARAGAEEHKVERMELVRIGLVGLNGHGKSTLEYLYDAGLVATGAQIGTKVPGQEANDSGPGRLARPRI